MDFQTLFKEAQYYSVFGSYIYNNSFAKDVDVVLINNKELNFSQFDTQTISLELFKQNLKNCEIKSLECLFSPHTNLPKEELGKEIDWSNLRASISKVSSHSFVKAKKKFIDNEFYIGQKSLYHSLRIIMFGIQLANNKNIINFSEANHFLVDILTCKDWKQLELKYKPIYNELHSQFKKVCPKN